MSLGHVTSQQSNHSPVIAGGTGCVPRYEGSRQGLGKENMIRD